MKVESTPVALNAIIALVMSNNLDRYSVRIYRACEPGTLALDRRHKRLGKPFSYNDCVWKLQTNRFWSGPRFVFIETGRPSPSHIHLKPGMLATWNASLFLKLINLEEYKPIVEAMIEANGTPFLRSLYSYTNDYPDEKRIVAHRLMLDNTVEGRRCLKATHVSIRDQPAVDSKSIHSQYSNADTLYRGSLKHDITLISPATYQRKRRPGAILSGPEGPINEHFVCLLTVWMPGNATIRLVINQHNFETQMDLQLSKELERYTLHLDLRFIPKDWTPTRCDCETESNQTVRRL